ncbi:MAG: hypothetical protein JKY56_21540 [Kofleriaceae bacterium]|nr:hypothetical protein [Kofleriaceae bacterium]
MLRDRCNREFPKNVLHSCGRKIRYLALLYGVVVLVFLAAPGDVAAESCFAPIPISAGTGSSFHGNSEASIVDAGFRAVTVAEQGRSLERTHLWIQLGEVPNNAHFVILESVWGAGPDSLTGMWGHALPIRNDHVFAYPESAHRYRDQPFTLGFRIRYVYEDGSTSTASLPVFINHTAEAASHDGLRADQIVITLCALLLLFLLLAYRQADTRVGKIRIAAMLSLGSLLFLAASPALPWMSVSDDNHRYASIDCHLGNEVQCATYAPDAGPNPLSRASALSSEHGQRRAEIVEWVGASSTLRSSIILCLILLLPALIWILVAPGLRAAHGAVFLGGSAAGYCFLAAVYYRVSIPSWMSVEHYSTMNLTIATTATILFSSGLIVFWSYFGSSECLRSRGIRAIAREV